MVLPDRPDRLLRVNEADLGQALALRVRKHASHDLVLNRIVRIDLQFRLVRLLGDHRDLGAKAQFVDRRVVPVQRAILANLQTDRIRRIFWAAPRRPTEGTT